MNFDTKLKKLFTEYEKAFNQLNFERVASMYTDSFMSAGPNGVISNSKVEFLNSAARAAGFYKSIGQDSARIISLEVSPISDQYSMAKTHWGVTFRKTGARLIEFDVTYFVYTAGDEPKIVMFIAHQDEEKAMKELGLMGDQPFQG